MTEWRHRPVLAWLLRVFSLVLPLAVGVAAALAVASILPEPAGAVQVLGWWMVVLGVSLVATLGADRLTRRLLPLAALYKLTLGFPDRAPSRLKVARVQGTVAQLQRWLDTVDIANAADRARAAEAIISLAAALSIHDPRTRGHAERVRAYTDLLSDELGLSKDDANKLRWAALMHDIGKLRVPAEILNSEQPLTDDQWQVIRMHPIEGMQIAEPLIEWLGPWADAIAHHHERWDGTGYPYGLAGDEIAYGARIVSVADAYDAITALRSYKQPISPEAARREIAARAGEQFDPRVVRAFLNLSIGHIRWIMGPTAWLSQIPFLGGFRRFGRDAVTVGLAMLLMLGLGVTGVLGGLGWLGSTEPASAQVLGETLTAAESSTVTTPETAGTTPSGDITAATSTTSTIPSSAPTTTTTSTSTTTTTSTTTPSATAPVVVGPQAIADQVTMLEDTTVEIAVLANDVAGTSAIASSSLSVSTRPGSGSARVGSGGTISYTPDRDFFGDDTLIYRVCDGAGLCSTASVAVSVTPVNDPPVAVDDQAGALSGVPIDIDVFANDVDVDGDRLTAVLGEVVGAIASVNGAGSITFEAILPGTIRFEYAACDPSGSCGRAMVTVVAVAPPGPIVADDDVVATGSVPVHIDVLANDDVLRSEVLSLTAVWGPEHGIVTPVAGGTRFKYRADRGYTGVDAFIYEVCTSEGCSRATVYLTIR